MGLTPKPVDYNIKYVITANGIDYETYVEETVGVYKAILDKFNIKYRVWQKQLS